VSQNGSKQLTTDKKIEGLSVQRRTEVQASAAGSGTIWFHRHLGTADDIWPWWAPRRDADLRQFVLAPGNDILQGAIASVIKKFKAMNWRLQGPKSRVEERQLVLSSAEFGKGWSLLISKVLYDFLSQDKGGFIELIGEGDPAGPIEGLPLGLAHLDAAQCTLTGDLDYPVVFNNAKDNTARKLHSTRVMHIVDLPSPNEDMNDVGFCSVSRVVSSSQILLKFNKYKNQKLDDLPPAGVAIFNNILETQFEDAEASYAAGRRRQGQSIFAPILQLFSLDPSKPASIDFIDFASVPDNFDENTATNLYINIVALSFGVDVREFWPISAGPLGTATETEVQHQKAKGKLIGEIISMVEREINWKVLPKSVNFAFDFQDDEEDLLRADINKKKTETIMGMWMPGSQDQETPVNAELIRQMLADNVDYFKEDFLLADITDEEDLTDTDREQKMILDRFGNIRYPIRHKSYLTRQAEENYRAGKVRLDQLVRYRMNELR
jgi:hypothetical protein